MNVSIEKHLYSVKEGFKILLTNGQHEAIKKAIFWYFNFKYEKNKPFIIAGVAGSGKSTVVNLLVHTLGLKKYEVLYATPTGKAALVLRMKGSACNTLHKTFYTSYCKNNKMHFYKKKSLPSIIKLIVIDELSMVNQKMMEDIISFEIPIIGLGDKGQLPALFGANDYISNPDVFLDEVMRQKGDIGILDLATMSRTGKNIDYGIYKESKVIREKDLKDMEKYDVILCWRNKTRKEINRRIRNILGFDSIYPKKNEKLMCLKNNYSHFIEYDDVPIMLVNGMNLISLEDSIENGENSDFIYIKCRPSFLKEGEFFPRVFKNEFLSYFLEDDENDLFIEDLNNEDTDDVVSLDYGYACTVHKSQGSEWDNVLVIDEFNGSQEDYNKWLYTAITRAKKSVTIVR